MVVLLSMVNLHFDSCSGHRSQARGHLVWFKSLSTRTLAPYHKFFRRATGAIKGTSNLELTAIYYVLLSFVEQLKHGKEKIFTDNPSTAWIVSFGGFRVHLQSVALSTFHVCFLHGTALEAQCIPRSLNVKVDLFCRFIDGSRVFIQSNK